MNSDTWCAKAWAKAKEQHRQDYVIHFLSAYKLDSTDHFLVDYMKETQRDALLDLQSFLTPYAQAAGYRLQVETFTLQQTPE